MCEVRASKKCGEKPVDRFGADLQKPGAGLGRQPHLEVVAAVKAAPVGWKESLRCLGPGLIVVGAVVGSGELVTTTLLGAKVGFVVLWLIILSCLIKVIIQEQFAYYVITSGGTIIDALNRVPGPRLRGLSCWCWLSFVFSILSLFPVGGIIGMSAAAAVLMFGFGTVNGWMLVLAVTAIALFWHGSYGRIQRVFVVMVACFSVSQFLAVLLTQQTDFAVTWAQVWRGLHLDLPQEGAYLALSAFGITGISAAEVMFYTYWCLEKGYGRFVGPPDGTEEWRQRAQGWISVMRKDAVLTALTYTSITIAFYFLGAAILHRTQADAAELEGLQSVVALSDIFTRSFGEWSFYVFICGALLVLYSTYVAAAASWPRFALDFLGRLGFNAGRTESQRNVWHNRFSIFFALFFVAIYFFIPTPVALIVFGGVLASVFLPVLGLSAVYLFHQRPSWQLIPSTPLRVLLWISTLIVLVLVFISVYLQF